VRVDVSGQLFWGNCSESLSSVTTHVGILVLDVDALKQCVWHWLCCTQDDDGSIELLIERMKSLSQIDTDDITYEELTERFEAVKTSSASCESTSMSCY